mmetsp:Transcript_27147/g.108715  ORF Transcript_27147/g.108715 Transcript_27147/m.108715 type:complete len:246 (+) Transcript_27147:407-1144(+)
MLLLSDQCGLIIRSFDLCTLTHATCCESMAVDGSPIMDGAQPPTGCRRGSARAHHVVTRKKEREEARTTLRSQGRVSRQVQLKRSWRTTDRSDQGSSSSSSRGLRSSTAVSTRPCAETIDARVSTRGGSLSAASRVVVVVVVAASRAASTKGTSRPPVGGRGRNETSASPRRRRRAAHRRRPTRGRGRSGSRSRRPPSRRRVVVSGGDDDDDRAGVAASSSTEASARRPGRRRPTAPWSSSRSAA